MTFSDEFASKSTQGEMVEEEPNYPSAFGITFTPQVSGIALSVMGVLGALYILVNFVMPAYQSYQQLKADEKAKEDQVNLQKSGALEKKLQATEIKLKQAQSLKSQVLALFSNEDTLDTLLLDIDGFLTSRNAKLINYKPQGNEATVINDGSLGALVNNKLKRQSINLEMEGTFDQTQSVLRDIERLQPLLMVKSLNSEMKESPFIIRTTPGKSQAEFIPLPATLKTTMTFDVVLPLTSEEMTAAKPPATPEGQQPQS